MRALALAAALLFALPGCLTAEPPVARLGLFSLMALGEASPTPVPYRSCDQLLDELNFRALRQSEVSLEQSLKNPYYYGGRLDWQVTSSSEAGVRDAAMTGAPGGTAAKTASAADAQVTGTNNQEKDADEGDLVKTDGEWTYVLTDNMVRILHSTNVGDVEAYAVIPLEGYGGELLLDRRDPNDASDDRLVVVQSQQRYHIMESRGMAMDNMGIAPYYEPPATHVLVYSLLYRKDPQLLNEYSIEGDLVGARLVAGTTYVMVHKYEAYLGLRTDTYVTEDDRKALGISNDDLWQLSQENQTAIRTLVAQEADRKNREKLDNLTLGDHLPKTVDGAGNPIGPVGGDADACRRVFGAPESTGRSITTILALSTGAARVQEDLTQVLGGRPIVYASGDALVLAAPSQDSWWFWMQPDLEEATDLQWFDLDGLDVTPRASGRVRGTVQDSFGIDVEGEHLRVATTTGQWGRSWLAEPIPMMNHVAVFEAKGGNLVARGMVGGIAPGERIWSARFTEERAYIVTFRNMDPLWVIDLTSNPPRILGELEIPGVSTYIHPLDDEALITIGYGPREDGQNLDWGRVQLSYFDISDPQNPKRTHKVDLSGPGSWGSSAATNEHKAFTYWAALGALAVPMMGNGDMRYDANGNAYWEPPTSELVLLNVHRDTGQFERRGSVDQSFLTGGEGGYSAAIARSYFLGLPPDGPVSVYAISSSGITAHDFATLQDQGGVAFASAPTPMPMEG